MRGSWWPDIVVRDDLPEGWVFWEDGEGRLVPMFAYAPDELEAAEEIEEAE